jgi:hypothetical protein
MGTVEFSCDLSQQGTELLHCWEHTVGSCHAPIALRADWQQQLRRCHSELGFRHVRFHGLLSDDVGTVVKHNDQLSCSFFNADQIIDFLLTIGMRPFVELSFMPTALASGSKTVFHYRGNVTPPKDYQQWSTLIHTLVGHWVDRYGIREVAEWFFEVWNEPNLKAFWTGTRQDYFKLYQVTANAIKTIDPSLKVGGPATARDGWIEEFLVFCEAAKVPVDFVTTHHYPTDALGHEDDDTRSWPTVSAASFANGRRTRGAEPASAHSTTPNGIRRPILEIRGTTNRTRRPLSRRRRWRPAIWSRGTVSGPSQIFLKRTIFRPCHFTGDLACSICMASPSPRIVRSSCYTSSEPNAYWLTACMRR